jgi:hypothetical protein
MKNIQRVRQIVNDENNSRPKLMVSPQYGEAGALGVKSTSNSVTSHSPHLASFCTLKQDPGRRNCVLT